MVFETRGLCLTQEQKFSEEIRKTELNGPSDRMRDKVCRLGLISARINFMCLGQTEKYSRIGAVTL